MYNTIAELRTLFQSNAAIQALVPSGKTLGVFYTEIWNIESNVAYPRLAFQIDLNEKVPEAVADRESGTLTIWFTDTDQVLALKMRDTIRSVLNKKHVELATANVLHVQYLAHETSHVGKAPQTAEYEAFLRFNITV